MANGPTPLRVETEVFEGPFDLLLHLVRVSEMDIFDIDIATITDQFLAHLVRMERQSIEVGGEFLVMASTLLNIKSRTLLPENPHADDGEEEDEGAIRTTEDLVHQLIEYRRFKEIARVLGDREVAQMRVFHRSQQTPRRRSEDEPDVPPQTLDMLLGAFARVVQAIGVDRRHEITEDAASVEDALIIIRERLEEESHCRLSELLRACRTRSQMIAVLLALLEMAKLGEVRIDQAEFYTDVHLSRREEPRPEVAAESPEEQTRSRAESQDTDAAPAAGPSTEPRDVESPVSV
jgi:segregation and condensation protein A